MLQRIMYDDYFMKLLLDWNQLAWAIDFPKDRYAKLWDPAERMPFVFDAADRLDMLLAGPARAQVEESIRSISTGAVIA